MEGVFMTMRRSYRTACLQKGIALAVAAALWVAALWLVAAGDGVGAVVGWIFLWAKGLSLLSTLAAAVRNRRLAGLVWQGRYRFDSRGWRGIWQALTRFGWELPQLWVGYVLAQWRVVCGDVVRVDTLDGITFVTGRHRDPYVSAGMSTGCFVQAWLPERQIDDFVRYARNGHDGLLRHEYGHTVDSQLWGWLYLPVVGVPSLVSQWMALNSGMHHRHETFWPERRADHLGARYFAPRQQDMPHGKGHDGEGKEG